jgi:hypothetical protein
VLYCIHQQTELLSRLQIARDTPKVIDQKMTQAGLCGGQECPEDKNFHALMAKYGYSESKYGIIDTEDVIMCLDDYISGNLVNKTIVNNDTKGNFCFSPTNCITQTEEAKGARALFDRYWK